MSRLVVLVGLIVAVAMAVPDGVTATSLDEATKLVASDAQAGDEFGRSLALSGTTAIVGAPEGDAAYVFERDEGGIDTWGEVTRLAGSDIEAGDRFGFSVAISGDVAVVGASLEDVDATNTGSAYVFQRDESSAGGWAEVAKLTASDRQHGDWFGSNVAIDGDTIVVGAYRAGEDDAGAAYAFDRDEGGAGAWGEVAKLTASDAAAGDWFGARVALRGDTAFVGVAQEDAGVGFAAGAVYLFRRDEGGADAWGEVTKLTASDAEEGDRFGTSVAVAGDTAVIGACCKDGSAIDAGAAYVFELGAGGWSEVAKLTASDAEAGDRFGDSVAVRDGVALVGASDEGVVGARPGAAYLFERDELGAGGWSEVAKLTASDAEADDFFGVSAALGVDIAVVGAYQEDAGGVDAGAAYVFGPAALVVPGDVGCDGTTNAVDAALLLQLTAGLLDSLACEEQGDVNGDGTLNALDAAIILQFVAGLLDALPP